MKRASSHKRSQQTRLKVGLSEMKRLALSLVCGLAIPFLYSITVGPLTPYIKNETLNRLASYPVRWPVLILYRLNQFPFENEIAILLYIVGCNVLLYTLLTYCFLWTISRRKPKAPSLPPDPPLFVQN